MTTPASPRTLVAANARRCVQKKAQDDTRKAEAAQRRFDLLLGMADELELGVLGADRESLSEIGSQRVSLWTRRARALRETVELLGGPVTL